jgi:hypothetical protein
MYVLNEFQQQTLTSKVFRHHFTMALLLPDVIRRLPTETRVCQKQGMQYLENFSIE